MKIYNNKISFDSKESRRSFALLPSQESLWKLDQLRGDCSASLRADLLRIPGSLDVGLFREALTKAVDEAAALQMHVRLLGGRPRLVGGATAVDCPLIDLSGAAYPSAVAIAWFDTQCHGAAFEPDMPLVRFALVRLEEDVHLWARFISQIAADANSRLALSRRVQSHLEALGGHAAAPPAPTPYSACLQAFVGSTTVARQTAALAYWRSTLARLPRSIWPATPPVGRLGFRRSHFGDLAQLRARAAAAGTSVARLAVAAFAQALGRHFARSAIRIGVQVDMRGGARFRDTVGCFSTVVPVGIDALEAPVPHLAASIGKTLSTAYRHGRILFPRGGRGTDGAQAVDVLFSYMPEVDNGRWEEVGRYHGPSAPLILSCCESGARLALTLDHDPNRLNAGDAEGLLQATISGLNEENCVEQPKGVQGRLVEFADKVSLQPDCLAAGLFAVAAARVLDRLDEEIVVAIQRRQAPRRSFALVVRSTDSLGAALKVIMGRLRDDPVGSDRDPVVVMHEADDPDSPQMEAAGAMAIPVERGIAQAWRCLLDDLPASLSNPASSLRIMDPSDERSLRRLGDGPRRELPRPATLPALIAAQAERTPDAPAVCDGKVEMSYRTLMLRAEIIAGGVRASGQGRGAIVGVRMSRSAEMVAALLGIHLAGAAFLPLDPRHPPNRQRYMLEDAGVRLVLTDDDAGLGVAELRSDRFEMETAAPAIDPAREGDVAYVLYTSGSTGRPKGVVIRQRSIANLAIWGARMLGPSACRGVVFSTSLTFDVAMFELFSPLVAGGRVLVIDNLTQLATSPLRDEALVVSSSPTVLDAVVRSVGLPPNVMTIVSAGEALRRDVSDRLLAARPGLRLVNAYGPTEATVYASFADIGRSPAAPTIGRPLQNMSLRVVDRQGALLPRGCEGELHIGGEGIAAGYLNRPDLTADRFGTETPAGGPIYRTGDRVRWDADGNLQYLGRADSQIKLHGVRIEPGEVEAAILRIGGIVAAAVGVRGKGGARRLVAWLVAPGGSPGDRVIRRRLMEVLPTAMIPATFVLLDALPVTSSGKLDRAALTVPKQEPPEQQRLARRPFTPVEQAVAGLWREVLDHPSIHEGDFGAEQTLEDLGVDSLGVVLVCAAVEAAHGLRVPPALIEAGLSLTSIATFLEQRGQPRHVHLIVDGKRLLPSRRNERGYEFELNFPIRDVRIVSPWAVPREVNGQPDDRRLGVWIESIAWEQAGEGQQVTLDQPFLGDGFHSWEPHSGRRWTDGHAILAGDLIPAWRGPARLILRCWDWAEGKMIETRGGGHQWLAEFESLGSSCEFGFVQQGLGAHVALGLLRWAATDHERLLDGLVSDFGALADPTRLAVGPSAPDHVLVTPYATMHTFQSLNDVGPDRTEVMLRRSIAAMQYLRRKLLDDLREGRKMFVFTSSAPSFDESDMRALKVAMAKHGPAPLLCVTAKPDGQAGPLSLPRRLADGLYAAEIGRFVGSSGPFDEWIAICRAALALRERDRLP